MMIMMMMMKDQTWWSINRKTKGRILGGNPHSHLQIISMMIIVMIMIDDNDNDHDDHCDEDDLGDDHRVPGPVC